MQTEMKLDLRMRPGHSNIYDAAEEKETARETERKRPEKE